MLGRMRKPVGKEPGVLRPSGSRWKAMLKRSSRTVIVISLLLAVSGCRHAYDQVTPTPSGSVRNSVGMQLRVAEENTQPTLRIVLPGHPTSDRAIEVIFPEHVTVRPRGSTDANHLYLWQPGQYGERPPWRRSERALAYERNLQAPFICWREQPSKKMAFAFTSGSKTSLTRRTI